MDGVHDAQRLKELQALPLERKIMITQTRIMEWYQRYNGNVYVSFSGGKDSTVLLHIARKMFPDIPAVFSNTGLEYYEIQRFAKQHDNVTFIAPKIRFDQVVSTFGYPLISKEVAEAIYYARRINSQPVQVERERESRTEVWRKRRELLGARRTNFLETGRLETNGNWGENQNLITTGTAANRRTILQGRWREYARRRDELHGKLSKNEQANRQRRAGVVGTPTKAGSATDGSCQGSEVPPG